MSEMQAQQPWTDAEVAARELERRLSLKVLRNEPLAEHTTMRVGGPADLLVTIRARFALRGLVRLAAARGWPLRILGRGSNVVVGDAGMRGIVALNRSAGYDVDQAAGTISFDSGVPMAKASTIAAEAGLTGLEFAAVDELLELLGDKNGQTLFGFFGGGVHGQSFDWSRVWIAEKRSKRMLHPTRRWPKSSH